MTDLYNRKALKIANAAIMAMLEPFISEPTKRQYNKRWRETNWEISAILQAVAADSFVCGAESRNGWEVTTNDKT
jgi:hypothetical protein